MREIRTYGSPGGARGDAAPTPPAPFGAAIKGPGQPVASRIRATSRGERLRAWELTWRRFAAIYRCRPHLQRRGQRWPAPTSPPHLKAYLWQHACGLRRPSQPQAAHTVINQGADAQRNLGPGMGLAHRSRQAFLVKGDLAGNLGEAPAKGPGA